MVATIGKWREDQPVTVDVGPYQQHGGTHRVETGKVGPATQMLHQETAIVPPGVLIEGRPAIARYTVRVEDVAAEREQGLDDVRRILDHVDVQPEHPVLILERARQEMI